MTKNRFDAYNQAVINALRDRHGYSTEDAEHLYTTFLPALEKLDKYDTPAERSDQIQNVVNQGLTVIDWIKHIEKIRGYTK